MDLLCIEQLTEVYWHVTKTLEDRLYWRAASLLEVKNTELTGLATTQQPSANFKAQFIPFFQLVSQVCSLEAQTSLVIWVSQLKTYLSTSINLACGILSLEPTVISVIPKENLGFRTKQSKM